MFSLYWRVVFKPYFWRIVLIATVTFLSSLAEIASIGLIVPVMGLFLESEQSNTSTLVNLFQNLAIGIGFFPSVETQIIIGMLIITALVILKNVLYLSQQFGIGWLSGDVANRYRAQLLDAYLHIQLSEILQRGRGAIIEDINASCDSLRGSVKLAANLLSALATIVTTFALMIYLSWWITFLLGGLVLLAIPSLRKPLEIRSRRIGIALHDLGRRQSALLVDALDGVRLVKTYMVEAVTIEHLQKIQSRYLVLAVRARVLAFLPYSVYEIFGAFLVILLVGLVLYYPNFGLDIPRLAVFTVSLRRLVPAASSLNAVLVQLSESLRHVEITDEVLNILPRETSGTRNVISKDLQTIKLENISFHYPGRSETRVLQELNLTFRRGQVTALVGPSGVGKTTIADLIVRLFEPIDGRILANGIDLHELSLQEWRRQIGYVSQDTFLFNASLRENISLWDETVNLEEEERAMYAAQLSDFVRSLPEGYETIVGDRGLELSGGQRQRVAIARAILHKPAILIFDEATSALDNITERAVHDAIGRLRANSIVILIAHRLSTVQDADQIVVLRSGRAVEQGNYEDLLLARGEFWQLYQGDEISLGKVLAG